VSIKNKEKIKNLAKC